MAIALALLSAASWGGLSVARKALAERMRAVSGVVIFSLLQLPFLAAMMSAGELLRTEAAPSSALLEVWLPAFPDTLGGAYWIWSLSSIFINLFANVLLFRALQISPISLTTPYLAFTPVFTALLGLLAYHQRPSALGWAGMAIVCLGAFFLSQSGEDPSPQHGARSRGEAMRRRLTAITSERGSLYALLVAVMWSVTTLCDKEASELSHPIWHIGVLAAGVGTPYLIYTLYKDHGALGILSELRGAPWWSLAAALLLIVALTAQLSAYGTLDVAYVETLKRGVEVIVVMAAGYFLFGERQIGRRLVAALVMVLGVTLTVLGG